MNHMGWIFLKSAALTEGTRFGQRTVTQLRRTLRLVVLASVFGNAASAQQRDDVACDQSTSTSCGLSEEQIEFLHRSQLATEKYQRLAAAVADGFQPVGADAPAMGRHWVNMVRLSDGEIDAASPEILMYAVVNGRDSLVGIGFGYAFGPNEYTSPPANPFPPEAWHSHSGRLDIESHRTDHQADGLHGTGPLAHGREPTAGISFLHVWVRPENPAGVIEPNNWALPYIRLGLARPEDATPEADRAVSLVSMGADFFITRAKLFTELGPAPAGGWVEALRRAETEANAWWRARPEGPISSPEIDWLGHLWRRLGLNGL